MITQFEPKERPILLSFIYLIGFLYTFLGVSIILFSPHSVHELVRIHGPHLPILSIMINIIGLIGFVGLWRMKYWGFVTYILSYIAGAILAQYTGFEIYWAYIPGFIVVLISAFYLNQFS